MHDDDLMLPITVALQTSGYAFTTVTPATHARVNARAENAWAKDTEGVLGWSRPFHEEVLPRPLFKAMQDAQVLERCGEGWMSRVRASTLLGQIYLHSAFPTTDSDAVFFGPDTYRFTQAISRHLASGVRVLRAVDIGCGAGPGAVVVAQARPEAEVVAVDISERALRFTRVNAEHAGAKRLRTCRSDLLSGVGGQFDLIVANPPYLLDPQARTYRHGGGSQGEGLSLAIANVAHGRLAPGGTLLLYTGTAIIDGIDGLLAKLEPVLDQPTLAWDYAEMDPDVFGEELAEPAYAHADRIAAVLLTVQKSAS